MTKAEQTHYPTIAAGDTPVMVAANMVTPPDGFDPDRNGASAWMAMRLARASRSDDQ